MDILYEYDVFQFNRLPHKGLKLNPVVLHISVYF
jgi:hypothetical protein